MRSINLIVIHCSATANGDSLQRGEPGARGARNAADIIDGWHAERGFVRTHVNATIHQPRLKHIGYHYVLTCGCGTHQGRSLDEPGAHAVNYNANSIGICLTGMNAYTAYQWEKLAELVKWLAGTYRIPLQPPVRVGGRMRDGICGHRDLSPDKDGDGVVEPFEWLKTCPGFDVSAWLAGGMKPLQNHLIEAKR